MKEIRQEYAALQKDKNDESSHSAWQHPIGTSRVVIVVRDERSLCQIRDFLSCPAYNPEERFSQRHSTEAYPVEGNLHLSMRQFVTQQATAIRQLGARVAGGGRGGAGGSAGPGRGRGRGGRVSDNGGGRGSGGVPIGDAGDARAMASLPLGEQAFQNLRNDQKMMLVLEKNLQCNNIAMEVLGVSDRGARQEGLDTTTSVADKTPPGKTRRKRTAATRTSAASKRLRGSLGQTGSTSPTDATSASTTSIITREENGPGDVEEDEATALILDEQLHIFILTHSMCQSAYNPFDDIQPTRVIFLDADVSVIRLVETYQAGCNRDNMKVSGDVS